MNNKSLYLLKISLVTIGFIIGLLFFSSQAQAAYKVSYDGTSFTVDSLQIKVEWNAIGCGHDDYPWIAFNGSIMQYDSPDYCRTLALDACCILDEYGGCSGIYDYDCGVQYITSENLSFWANLQVGQNSIEMASNNGMCDSCSYCPDVGPCDGVYAKITFSNGQVLYTDGNWEGLTGGAWQKGGVISLSCSGYSNYLQTRTCGDCCETHARKTINVDVYDVPSSVDIKANGSNGPITLNYQEYVNLSWTSQNAVSCEASGDWSGSKATSGSQTIQLNLVKTYNFNITCKNAGQTQTATDSIQVIAKAKPPTVITKPAVATW